MHHYLWRYRKLHIKKSIIKTSLSINTEVMASSHHRHLLRYCSYTPSMPPPQVCKQSLPPNLLTCLEVWVWAMVCFTCVAGLVPWQGIKENNTWQGRRASHCSEKKAGWPQQLFLHLSFSYPCPSEETSCHFITSHYGADCTENMG